MRLMPKLPKGVKNVEDGGTYVRMIVPSKNRWCAPCLPDSNWCLEGKIICNPLRKSSAVHHVPEGNLALPALPWLRRRILEHEWAEFVAAFDVANLEGTMPFAPCVCCPCTFPCLCCQPLCCCLPFQYDTAYRLKGENALNLCIAKYNRYLFNPRGIMVRRQKEVHTVEDSDVCIAFLRLDYVPPGAPLPRYDRLREGIRPGTQPTDLKPITRLQMLKDGLWPLADTSPWFAWSTIIGEPAFFYGGDEPAINDAVLQAHHAKRKGPVTATIADTMQRV